MTRHNDKDDVITASEISQYAYCPVSWYLKRNGCPPDSSHMARGIHAHQEIGKGINRVQQQERRSKLLSLGEYSLLIMALLLIWWSLRFQF
ncbi:Uncharacterised protein [uncultured archaeon]|nr:Uncharacterised protein [uncultured archaeon]